MSGSIVERLREAQGLTSGTAQADGLLWDAADTIEALELALAEIEVFADVRSKDDSKTFARVNRGALRNIATKARAALARVNGLAIQEDTGE